MKQGKGAKWGWGFKGACKQRLPQRGGAWRWLAMLQGWRHRQLCHFQLACYKPYDVQLPPAQPCLHVLWRQQPPLQSCSSLRLCIVAQAKLLQVRQQQIRLALQGRGADR